MYLISAMVLVNKKMLAGGMLMIIVGLVLTININAAIPIGQAGMTEEEVIDLLIAEQENEDYNTLAGILFGLGFLLVLISFGARKKKGKPTKQVEKKVE
jgi:dolichol kinase